MIKILEKVLTPAEDKKDYAALIEKIYNEKPEETDSAIVDFADDVGESFLDISFDPQMAVAEVLPKIFTPEQIKQLYYKIAGGINESI